MGFKRAEWHSGLTYRQTCDQCHTVITYKDDVLDFRPWYADGFIICPNCKRNLRHKETYDISRPTAMTAQSPNAVQSTPMSEASVGTTSQTRAAFCSRCGKAFAENDNFCTDCGNKRD